MNKVLLITGGSVNTEFSKKFLQNHRFDISIGVDGGVKHAMEIGCKLDYAVGDFDTLSNEDFIRIPTDCKVLKLKPEKDETDTEAAMNLAIEKEAQEIWILGGVGSRIDHSLANIYLLYTLMKKGVIGYIVNENNKIYMIDKTTTIKKDLFYNKYFSILPYTEKVTGVTLLGFKYSLENHTISAFENQSRCVSNEFTDEAGMVKLNSGVLIVIESCESSRRLTIN